MGLGPREATTESDRGCFSVLPTIFHGPESKVPPPPILVHTAFGYWPPHRPLIRWHVGAFLAFLLLEIANSHGHFRPRRMVRGSGLEVSLLLEPTLLRWQRGTFSADLLSVPCT